VVLLEGRHWLATHAQRVRLLVWPEWRPWAHLHVRARHPLLTLQNEDRELLALVASDEISLEAQLCYFWCLNSLTKKINFAR
jgi:hypothetical protein